MRRLVTGIGLLVLAVILGSGMAFVVSRVDGAPTVASLSQPDASITSTASPSPTTTAPPTATASPRPRCPTSVAQWFAPRSISLAGRTVPVIAPPRDAHGVPGTPPVDTSGKWEFAFDTQQGIRPGDAFGHVLLNAHTWPDGSALGNSLLDQLTKGDRIVVRGGPGKLLCYRVSERVEVLASQGYPRYYATTGAPALAIIVCSGRRLGPGQWEKRTIWFAGPGA